MSDCHCHELGAFLFHWFRRLDDISVEPLLLGYQDSYVKLLMILFVHYHLGENMSGGSLKVLWTVTNVMVSMSSILKNEEYCFSYLHSKTT